MRIVFAILNFFAEFFPFKINYSKFKSRLHLQYTINPIYSSYEIYLIDGPDWGYRYISNDSDRSINVDNNYIEEKQIYKMINDIVIRNRKLNRLINEKE